MAAVVAATLAACGGGSGGGSSSGSASVSGLVGGTALNAKEAVSAVITNDPACAELGTPLSVGSVFIDDVGGFCAIATQPCKAKPSSTAIGLVLFTASQNGGAPPGIVTGAYPVTDSPTADAQGVVRASAISVFKTNSSCIDDPSAPTVTAGSVTVTGVSGNAIKGSFTATLSDGSTVSGTFDAASCAVPATAICGAQATCTGTRTCG